jgi:hypothetical protein
MFFQEGQSGSKSRLAEKSKKSFKAGTWSSSAGLTAENRAS